VPATRKRFVESLTVRFVPGTFDRIDPLLQADEVRADFIRVAIEREIRRRETSALSSANTARPALRRTRR
jgi:hypothetical protein